MDPATNTRALRIGAACLLAVFALLVMRAPWASAGAGDPADEQAEAATCGSGLENPAAEMELTVAEIMEQTRREQAEAEVDPSAWVVLNNRGYNYGPPHPVRIDPEIFLEEGSAEAR